MNPGPDPELPDVDPAAADDAAAEAAADATEAEEAELARLREEQARLEAEVGDLRSRLSREGGRPRVGRFRRVLAVFLVIVTSIVFTVGVAGLWARRNALNTDKWVDTVGPVADDPAVQAALSNWMTTEVMGLIDAEEFFESVLPERGRVLAVPLANAVRGFVADRVDRFITSDTFQRLWLEVNRRAHARVVDVLEGDLENLPNVQVTDGNVRINLIPVIDRVLAEIGEESPELFGRTVDIPTITVDDVPEAAIAKLEDALGRDIPDDFGQFTVFEAQRLDQVQDAVDLFDRLVVALAVLAVLLVALTLWVSPRRRTVLQLAVGIALGVVLLRRVGIRLEEQVADMAKPENRDAVRVVVGAFTSSLLDATAWFLALAAVVAVVAAVTGPYRWARSLRRAAASGGRALGQVAGAAVGTTRDERTARWVAAHRDLLQVGGVVVAILVLLAADLSWLGLLLVVALVGAFELGVWRLAEGAPPPEDGEPPGPPGAAVEAGV